MSSHLSLVPQVLQVRDVARALDITSAQLLQVAAVLGMRVSCPSTVLTADQAEQLEAAWIAHGVSQDAATA